MYSREAKIIDLPAIGESNIGYISVVESQKQVPFPIKRVYWTYFTPESIIRGRHAHRETEQVLVAVAGTIKVTIESAQSSDIQAFILDRPSIGLYVPPTVWHTMHYSHTAVQLVLASHEYDPKDYIRNYEEFKEFWGKN